MKYSRTRKESKYSPSRDEVRKNLSSTTNKRAAAIIILAYHCGITPADITKFKVGDYSTTLWTYFICAQKKNGYELHGVPTPEGSRAMREYLAVRKGKDKEPLWMGQEGQLNGKTISYIITTAIERAGLNH